MEKKTHEEKRHREAVLGCMKSVELGVLLREMGWEISGRQIKARRRAAILHLEGYEVAGEIVRSLGLKRVEGGEGRGESGAAAIVGDGDVVEGAYTDGGTGVILKGTGWDTHYLDFTEEMVGDIVLSREWVESQMRERVEGDTVGIIRFDDGGQPIDRDEALAVVKRVAEKGRG